MILNTATFLVLLALLAVGFFVCRDCRRLSPRAIARVLDQMETASPDDRRRLASNLCYAGRRSAAEVPRLAALLTDRDNVVSLEAIFGLARMGPAARDAIPQILTFLRGPASTSDKYFALEALSRIRCNTPEVRQILEELLAGSDTRLRTGAAYALWAITGEKDKPVRLLIDELEHGKKRSQVWSLYALRRMRRDATPALNAIAAAAKSSPYRDVRGRANDVAVSLCRSRGWLF